MSISDRSIHVLVIDDDMIDIKHIQNMFKDHHVKNTIDIASSGEEALNKLYGINNVDILETLPTIILLDINMPTMNGFEFLKILRSDPKFKSLPICIISGSHMCYDKKMARDLKISAYFEKPLIYEEFIYFYKPIVENIS
jgi:CheY-like chemotaxis protein